MPNGISHPYTLGLDIVIASVGAALLGEERILGLHVRTFDRAETAKEGESLNKIRRDARLVRRRLYRRAQRLLRLRRLFKRQGLVSEAEPSAFVTAVSPWKFCSDHTRKARLTFLTTILQRLTLLTSWWIEYMTTGTRLQYLRLRKSMTNWRCNAKLTSGALDAPKPE